MISQIDALYEKHGVSLEDKAQTDDAEEVQKFIFDSQQSLAKLEDAVSAGQSKAAAETKIVVEIHNPTSVVLNCKEFHGSKADKLSFGQWLPQFKCVIKK